MSISAIPSSTFTQSPLGVSSNNYQQDLVKLGKDLASGSLSAAQQDFSTLQQDIQNAPDPASGRIHHHHPPGRSTGLSADQNSLQQLLTQLGQDLSSGNLSAARQAYSNVLSSTSTIGARHPIEPPTPGIRVALTA